MRNGVEFFGKLRFAVMCRGDKVPAASAKCIEELLSIRGLELALLIVVTSPPLRQTTWQKAKIFFSFKDALWALYTRALQSQRLACYRPVDMSRIFAAVPRIHCQTIWDERFGQYFRPEDIETIREHRLDFILGFCPVTIRGDILKASKYGTWSFHYGDETEFQGGPPAFWEIYHDASVTGATLQRLTDNPGRGLVLQKCFVQTRKYSYGENLNAITWATTYMPGRVCRDIFRGCAHYLNEPPGRTDALTCRYPNNFEMLKFSCKTATTWLKRLIVSILLREDWNVGVVQEPIHAFLDPNFQPQVEWLSYQKADSYIADPFLLKIGSKLKLMVEEFDWRSNRGSIVETELSINEASSPPFRKALDEGVHMSYPYLFEYEGRYYCMPEASQKRSVSLYMLDLERGVWSLVATLIRDFAAVDPTIFQHDGRWWLFCTNLDDEQDSKLFLWHAPELLGPWAPHPGNPVKVDVRSSRSAGRPFVFEGRLYRPTQDCSQVYGGAVTINYVTRLTTQEFSEEPAAHVHPVRKSRYPLGIHTVVCCDSITVIDGKRMVFASAFVWRRIKHKLRKLMGK